MSFNYSLYEDLTTMYILTDVFVNVNNAGIVCVHLFIMIYNYW